MSTAAPPPPPPRKTPGRRWIAVVVVVAAAVVLASLLGPERPAQEPLPPPPPDLPLGTDPESPEVALELDGVGPLLRRYELPAGRRFELEISQGAVAVAPGPPGAVIVEAVLGDGDAPPERFEWSATEEGDALRVKIESRSRSGWLERLLGFGGESGRPASLRQVRVRLPADAELSVRTGAGGVRVEDRQGPVDLRTGAGDVELRRQAGAARIETGAGDVLVEDAAAELHVRTGAGGIEVLGALAAVDLRSGAGGVRLSGEPSSVTVDTGAGGVELSLAALRGPVEVDTGMGGIELELPAGAGCELRAETGLGSVQVDSGGRRLEGRRGEPLVATLGGGGPKVSLQTGTGAIRVREAVAAE